MGEVVADGDCRFGSTFSTPSIIAGSNKKTFSESASVEPNELLKRSTGSICRLDGQGVRRMDCEIL